MDILVRKYIDITRMREEAKFAWSTAVNVAAAAKAKKITLTSGHRLRKRGNGFSFHNVGLAIDFVVDLHEGVGSLSGYEIKLDRALGSQFQVIYHDDRDGIGKHFHLEFDEYERTA